MKTELEEYKSWVIARLGELSPFLQKYALGDFSDEIPIPEEEDAFTELLVGINLMVDDFREMLIELRSSKEFIDKIIDTSTLSTWISDEKGTAIRANPACLEFFGATEAEVIGKYNLLKDSVIEKNGFMPEVRRVFEKGESVSFVMDYDFQAVDHVDIKNATHKIIHSTFTPILDEQGHVTNVIVQTTDLTEIKKVENELKQRLEEMETFNRLAIGRELQMIELKQEINNLSVELGKEAPYDLSFVE